MKMWLRYSAATAGLLLAGIGVFMPQGWQNELSHGAAAEALLFDGVTLFQGSLVIEGIVLLFMALTCWTYVPVSPNCLPRIGLRPEAIEPAPRTLLLLLIATVFLGAGLRLFRLDTGMWLDEIVTLATSRGSLLDVLTVYISSNNHLLNTVLVKASTGLFGDSSWAVRLPAALFGIATVPVIYLFSRGGLSRWQSVFTALVLVVSYHHIFFSQNARGYAGYLLFSMVSTLALVKGMQRDRPAMWALFVASTVLNFASILNAAFVSAGHVLISVIALFVIRSQGGSPAPLFRRLFAVFAISGLLVIQLYSVVIPQALAYVGDTYEVKSTGFEAFSLEFLVEMARGVSAGFGPGVFLGALPFLVIAGVGFFVVFRRNWVLALGLALPGALTATFLLLKGLTFSPRFFLLWLPLAILSAVAGLHETARFAAARFRKSERFGVALTGLLVVLVSVASASSLPYYYRVPKQNYADPIELIESKRTPEQIVIVVYTAEEGVRYYSQNFGVKENVEYFYVRSLDRLNEVLSEHPLEETYLITTFERALEIDLPDLATEIHRHWQVAHTFSATIGDGEVSVWRPKPDQTSNPFPMSGPYLRLSSPGKVNYN